MRIVAGLASAWVAWRWLGFLVGLVRIRRFEGPTRREARRTVVACGAWSVFLTVGLVYLWAWIYERQPGAEFVGFLAAAMMCSLAIGIAAGFMQPEQRTPETLGICRVRPTSSRSDAGPSASDEGGHA